MCVYDGLGLHNSPKSCTIRRGMAIKKKSSWPIRLKAASAINCHIMSHFLHWFADETPRALVQIGSLFQAAPMKMLSRLRESQSHRTARMVVVLMCCNTFTLYFQF